MINSNAFRRFFSLTHKSVSRQNRRRAYSTLNVSDALESRRLLSGNQPPEMTDVIVDEGEIVVVVSDDNNGGILELLVDLNDDGTVEYTIPTFDGDTIVLDLSMDITPNTTMPVHLELAETTYYPVESVQSDTDTVTTPGVTVTATPFTIISATDGTINAEVDLSSVNADVHFMYREVGETIWNDLGVIQTNNFEVLIYDADGTKDFEFATDTRFNSVSEMSAAQTVNDLPPYVQTTGQQTGNQDAFWSDYAQSN